MTAIAARALRIPGEGAIETLGRALALEAQGVSMIHLEVGQPDFPTPAHIVEAGWTCTGSPSVCTTTCGDGLVAAGAGGLEEERRLDRHREPR